LGTSQQYVTARTGETAAEGGAREAREEAGVSSFIGELRLLRVEQTESRFRWILHARAATDVLKTEPDDESEGARWVTLRECAAIDSGTMRGIEDCYLRGDEPMKWFEYVALGRPSFALSEFVQATTERGAIAFHGRAAYHTSSAGRIAVVRKSTGLVAAFHDSGALRTGAFVPRFSPLIPFQVHSAFRRLQLLRIFPSCRR
jgi:ADP-ribose pyrophosphatase YjhB (NUDIX family)